MKISFAWGCLMIMAALAVPRAAATGLVAVSGRVYQGAGNAGIANAAIYLCGGNGYAYTDADGKWNAMLEPGAGYCARVVGGLPPGDVAMSVTNNPEESGSETYEYQYAGKDCYKNSSCSEDARKWDRVGDGGVDFAVGPPPSVTPAAVPAPAAAVSTLKSADGVAVARLAAGLNCTLTPAAKLPRTTWGPYTLACQDANGQPAPPQRVTWSFSLGNAANSYQTLSVLGIGADGKSKSVAGASYDKKGRTVVFAANSNVAVGVQGSKLRAPLFYLVLAGVAIIIGGATVWQWWRARHSSVGLGSDGQSEH